MNSKLITLTGTVLVFPTTGKPNTKRPFSGKLASRQRAWAASKIDVGRIKGCLHITLGRQWTYPDMWKPKTQRDFKTLKPYLPQKSINQRRTVLKMPPTLGKITTAWTNQEQEWHPFSTCSTSYCWNVTNSRKVSRDQFTAHRMQGRLMLCAKYFWSTTQL